MLVTAFVMSSTAFSVACRALCTKRKTFSKELTTALNDDRSEFGLNNEILTRKKDYFGYTWDEIVTSTEDCIGLIDDGEEQGEEQIEGSY